MTEMVGPRYSVISIIPHTPASNSSQLYLRNVPHNWPFFRAGNYSTMTVADRFTQDSLEFFEWLRQQPGVTINPKINIADFRTRGAGRGISNVSLP